MIAYLTSHIGGSYVLIISADADALETNDSIVNTFAAAFPMSGLSINRIIICDKRNENIVSTIHDYDVIILAGGHVPTQNTFFDEIGLKDLIKDFDGILIGISAGTMNSAEVVYAQPELEGESIDKEYRRFLPGLGITKLMILPHYQDLKDEIIDGKRLFEDITYPDSYGRKFYALVDGSYLLIENQLTTLFGEAYLINDGNTKQICEKDQSICIK